MWCVAAALYILCWRRAGVAQAHTLLGELYDRGHGVPRDAAKAVEHFAQAAQQGDPQGIFNLGWSYYFGEGVEQNVAEGMKWMAAAAESGQWTSPRSITSLPLFNVVPNMVIGDW